MEVPIIETAGHTQYNAAKHNTKMVEIVTRVICTLFCVGVLIPASFAIVTIDKVVDAATEFGIEYEDAGSYRAAAGWLVSVASASIIAQVLEIVIHVLYINSVVKSYSSSYVYINALVCVIFILSLLSGGIANSVFAAENGRLWNENCFRASFQSDSFCSSLQRITDSEAASAAFSFLSTIIYIILFFIVVGGHVYKPNNSLSNSHNEVCPSSDVPPPYDSLDPPSYEAVLTCAPVDTPPSETEASNTQ